MRTHICLLYWSGMEVNRGYNDDSDTAGARRSIFHDKETDHARVKNGTGQLSLVEYQALGQEAGAMATADDAKVKIGGCIVELYRKVKFLSHDEELTEDGMVARFFYKHLNIAPGIQGTWLQVHRKKIRKGIDNRRSYVCSAIKDEFLRKLWYTGGVGVCVRLFDMTVFKSNSF